MDLPRKKPAIRAKTTLIIGSLLSLSSVAGILWVLGIAPFTASDKVEVEVTMICASPDVDLSGKTVWPIDWRIVFYDQGDDDYSIRLLANLRPGAPEESSALECGAMIIRTNKSPRKVTAGRFGQHALSSTISGGYHVTKLRAAQFPLELVSEQWPVQPHSNAFSQDDVSDIGFTGVPGRTLFDESKQFWVQLEVGSLNLRESFSERGLSLHVRPGTHLFGRTSSTESPADTYVLNLSAPSRWQISSVPAPSTMTAQSGTAHLSWNDLYINDRVDVVLANPGLRRQGEALTIALSTVFGAGVSAILEAFLAMEWLSILATPANGPPPTSPTRCTAKTRAGTRCRNVTNHGEKCHVHRHRS